MKIVWKEFEKPIALDIRSIKHKDNINEAHKLFLKINDSNSNNINQDDVKLFNEIVSLIDAEKASDLNNEYYANINYANTIFYLISDKAINGAYFRLEDGRQIGPITSVNMLFEQAGDGAIILSYGVQTEAAAWGSPRRSFTRAAFAKIKDEKAARCVVKPVDHLAQVLLTNQEKT